MAVAFSGGPDSTALLALALRHGLAATAHHVDHGLRAESAGEAGQAVAVGTALGCPVVVHRAALPPGPNLEARARDARRALLPAGTLTGHTADDQAETVVLRLLRGSGAAGLAAIAPGPTHPLLGLRRGDTHAVAEAVARATGVPVVHDASNDSPVHLRNRVRHDVMPLLADVAGRDVVPLLTRTADVLRTDDELLDRLAAALDPTDARSLAAAEPALARRAVRHWLATEGYPPDLAAVERVLDVARGTSRGCELAGGVRVTRSAQRLTVTPPERTG
ncbi:MAG TPA: tRNA lysidine(34) synthetase [Ilumatobacter sp.]|nr:tRNA lysidine(34) synthetase [Ilumatobacter sp.]